MENNSSNSLEHGVCPNPLCKWHNKINLPQGEKWFRCHGFYQTKQHGRIPRYICNNCHRTFTLRTGQNFWHLKDDAIDIKELGQQWVSGLSIREIAKNYGMSEQVISTRLKRYVELSKTHWEYKLE